MTGLPPPSQHSPLASFVRALEATTTDSRTRPFSGEPEAHQFRIAGREVALAFVHYQDPRGLRACADAARSLTTGEAPLILAKLDPMREARLFWIPTVVGSAAERAGLATFDPYFDYSHPAVLSMAESLVQKPHAKGQILFNLAAGLAGDLPAVSWDVLGLYGYLVKEAKFEVDKNHLLTEIRRFFIDTVDPTRLRKENQVVIDTVNEVSRDSGRRLNLNEAGDISAVLRKLVEKEIYLTQEQFLVHILPAIVDISDLQGEVADLHQALERMSRTLGEDVASFADELVAATRLPPNQRESAETLEEKCTEACWFATKGALDSRIRDFRGPILIVAPGYLRNQIIPYLNGMSDPSL